MQWLPVIIRGHACFSSWLHNHWSLHHFLVHWQVCPELWIFSCHPFSSSSSSYFISVSLDFNSLLFSAWRRETRFLPNTRSMKKVWSCFLFIPTDFNLDLQFSLKWLKHLRPVSFVTVSPKALHRACSPSMIYPRPFLANSGQLAQTAHAIFL